MDPVRFRCDAQRDRNQSNRRAGYPQTPVEALPIDGRPFILANVCVEGNPNSPQRGQSEQEFSRPKLFRRPRPSPKTTTGHSRTKAMKCAIYARVSTKKHETAMQLTDLRGYAQRMEWEAMEYIEQASSVKDRPEFERLMADARLRKFDVVLVWKVDRFARSMKQFVDTVLDLDRAGVCFKAITQNISSDQKDPMGQFVLGLFGLLAQLERAMMVERVNAGVPEAKWQGKALRPAVQGVPAGPGHGVAQARSKLARDRQAIDSSFPRRQRLRSSRSGPGRVRGVARRRRASSLRRCCPTTDRQSV